MREALPEKPHKIECGILNLGEESGKGTHWKLVGIRKKQYSHSNGFTIQEEMR